MPDDLTLLEQAFGGPTPTDTDDGGDDATREIANTSDLHARATNIGGEEVDVNDPLTGPTFDDVGEMFSGEYGRPRPREFWTAKQLGQTPPMQLIKIVVTQQLTGGDPVVRAPDGDLAGGAADLGDLIEDIYRGPHFRDLGFDDLITATVSDLIDLAWAYWELQESADGSFPVAQFKPLPPLQIQHTVDEDSGDFGDDPAYWWVPYKNAGGSVRTDGDAEGLERDRVVAMRAPQNARSGKLYGESIATKVREWLELIIDVDVHQKRHYSDSELPAGFLHFHDSLNDGKLSDVENDIIEAAGDPHDLVTVDFAEDINWIPVGESVVDLDAIQQQEWYFKLVLAAAGLNANEIGLIEGSGFAKETPAMQRAVYKKVTKPFLGSILDPQNAEVLPRIREGLDASIDERLVLDLERFDPVQEQVERQETMDEWREKAVSLNELRGGIGREATDVVVEIEELGGEVNIADLPRYVVDKFLGQQEIRIGEDAGDVATEGSGPPDFATDPVLTEQEAFATLGYPPTDAVTRQLDDTVSVQSSFIESLAYAEPTEFLQIEFERDAQQNAIYWYGDVPEYRFWNMLQASSKGKYFNRYIRGEYTYARLQ